MKKQDKKSDKKDRIKEIVKEGKKKAKEKMTRFMFSDFRDEEKSEVYDVEIKVVSKGEGEQDLMTGGFTPRVIYTIKRKGIELWELKYLVENMEKITEDIDGISVVSGELKKEKEERAKIDISQL